LVDLVVKPLAVAPRARSEDANHLAAMGVADGEDTASLTATEPEPAKLGAATMGGIVSSKSEVVGERACGSREIDPVSCHVAQFFARVPLELPGWNYVNDALRAFFTAAVSRV
jgi:hypothetical protein